VLDERTDGGGKHLAIMNLSLLTRSVATQTFGTLDEGGHGDMDAFVGQAIAQGGVVVAGDGQVRILDDLLLFQQGPLDLCLNCGRQLGGCDSAVGNREGRRILAILLQQHKEPALADTHHSLNIGP
jgi:hypothetical protein